jgi:putative Ca2+/H+ antiporter (TMEM165/GDT1 family)
MNPQNITSIPSSIPSPIPEEIPYIEKQFVLTFKFSALQSFILTFLAELGDKTFIMLIILQLKTNKVTILFSSLFAEILMNSIAIFIGWTIDYMLYKNLIDYIGIVFFLVYGIWLFGELFRTKKETFENEILSANKNHNKELTRQINSPQKTTELAIIQEEDDEININQPLLDNKTPIKNTKIENSFSFGEKLSPEESYEKERREEELKAKEENIDFKVFWTIFKRMALSECGDRTQWTSLIMSAIFNTRGVLLGSCCALTITCIIGVYYGQTLVKYLHESTLNFLLGIVLLSYAFQIFAGK